MLGNTVLHPYRTVETHKNVSPVGDILTHSDVRFIAECHWFTYSGLNIAPIHF